jgi:uncharacterized membrane protein YtjA (UPF0391 family)
MLKRAANCLVIAMIAAIFGFTGILQWTAVIAQSVCLVCLGVAVLSLLFSLFEEPSEASAREIPLGAEPQTASQHRP